MIIDQLLITYRLMALTSIHPNHSTKNFWKNVWMGDFDDSANAICSLWN